MAGVFVGGFIGWALDQWLDTRFFIVVFLFLGIAAGFLNVIREAQRMGDK
ncbi:ATPase F0F1 [Rhodomicrobium udaipurense JA643]|nr:AtpZ/AtpI family protein [Rhodomicrobium udaipurense]KAI94583.1 ATPase F0F1 [Rhodomicrobium udaipurense JA643]